MSVFLDFMERDGFGKLSGTAGSCVLKVSFVYIFYYLEGRRVFWSVRLFFVFLVFKLGWVRDLSVVFLVVVIDLRRY